MRLLLILAAMLPATSLAAECRARSGEGTAALVELYTSEGCSSCPPADRWLSTFVNPHGNRRVVPVAFHVSYWDYIGWKDAFADERYTQRQRALAKATGARMVYTPQVILAGRDHRDWRTTRAVETTIDALNRTKPGADITLASRARAEGGITGEVEASPAARGKARDLALFVLATQNGLTSRVTAGENRGEKLSHDFVVRDMAVIHAGDDGALRGRFTFKPKPGWNAERMALAAFVQNLKTGEVLQALSAPLCR